MLGGLKLPTDPRWVNLAEKSIEDILTDHAYCEQKAATNCITIIQMFPEFEEIVEALMPIVTEEWGHFRMVVDQLKKRDLGLGRQRKDLYVNRLQANIIQGGSREHQLVERLLVAALIEARSCERFRLLSLDINDEDLKAFYKNLMVSEAGHFRLFLDLAMTVLPKEQVLARWEEYLILEADILKNLELRGDRIH
ncbi:MAG: tRNA-(ms[2]io[6]A)-hydroxylase [Chitinophagales bacterium]|nr:tRNA-(ms[2]io[6]A)-hydroxylase [Chitinophagales bacterium]